MDSRPLISIIPDSVAQKFEKLIGGEQKAIEKRKKKKHTERRERKGHGDEPR